MHAIRTILLLGALLLPALANGAETRRVAAAPRITAVTVYPDRAMTIRSVTLDLKPGSYLISLEPLPVLLQDDSIRVEGKGSAGATIVGMEVKRAFLAQLPEQRAGEIEEEIRTLQRKLGSLDARKAASAAQKGFIESIRVGWGERISKELAVGKPTAAELNEALTFVGNGISAVEEKTRDLETESARIRDRIDALNRQLEAARGSGRRETKSVEVNVEVKREGKLTLELSGVVPQAGWEPSYDARLAADGASTELLFRALVTQQTGEEWNNVDLSLSTARPAVGGTPPELYPWRISFYRPPVPMPRGAAAGSAMTLKRAKAERGDAEVYGIAPDALALEAPAAPAPHLTAQVAAEQTSILFHIPRPVDIPSDGTRHGSIVAMETIPVNVEYLAVPKLSPHAFLRSELVNNAPYPLLPGKVNIFSNGSFIGTSQLKRVASGEKFDLFFGVDDQVAVKREELKRHKEGGLFGSSRQSYRYRIEAANFRKETRTVTIRDQLPLAGDEEIKVSLEEPSQKPDEVKGDGTLVWKLQLKPGEKRELTFGIAVEYPKEREITGL